MIIHSCTYEIHIQLKVGVSEEGGQYYRFSFYLGGKRKPDDFEEITFGWKHDFFSKLFPSFSFFFLSFFPSNLSYRPIFIILAPAHRALPKCPTGQSATGTGYRCWWVFMHGEVTVLLWDGGGVEWGWVGRGQELGHVIHSTNPYPSYNHKFIRPSAISLLGDFSLSLNGQPILAQPNFHTLYKSG